ncbi:MAG TPA: hypothetical protein ENK02_15285 [Planctomycetes bacterium]|nr:hypothetical protein [Planctomycetota bacterium]
MRREGVLRFGIVGPRRVRQGLGPFFALQGEALGAKLVGTASSSRKSARRAGEELLAALGHPVSTHVGASALCENEDLDALIIASPPEFHEEALRAALVRDIPCLVEKPLLWEGPGSAAKVAEICSAFEEKNLPLWVHCQWPETLASYFQLFPEKRNRLPVREFRMRLSPTSNGPDMLSDSLPHILSLCQALVPGERCRVSDPQLSFLSQEGLDLRFCFHGENGSWPCFFELRRVPQPPRPAGYGWDGDIATREIELPQYQQFFRAGNRRISIPDPLVSLLSAFFDSIREPKLGKILPAPTDRAEMMESLILAVSHAWEEEKQ